MTHVLFMKCTANVKESKSSTTKVLYFSDGCGTQYKNYIPIHYEDFGLEAECVFLPPAMEITM